LMFFFSFGTDEVFYWYVILFALCDWAACLLHIAQGRWAGIIRICCIDIDRQAADDLTVQSVNSHNASTHDKCWVLVFWVLVAEVLWF